MDIGVIVQKPPIHWEVNLDYFGGKEIGDALVSPLFKTNSVNKWRLVLYPKGKNERCKGFLSLYLQNCSLVDVQATFSLSLMNQSNFKVENCGTVNNGFFKTQDSADNWGFLKFTKESFVMDPKNHFIRDNKLTILCNIEMENKILNKLKLSNDFEQLLTNQEFSDVIITAEGKNFYLHKCILTARSTYFQGMFKHDMKEKIQNAVEIEETKYEVLEELFRFIYSGKISDNAMNMICEILTAAEKYCVDDLKDLCTDMMSNCLSESNALAFLNSAIINNAEKLESSIINYVSSNLDDFVFSEEFNRLGCQYPTVLIKIMQSSRKR